MDCQITLETNQTVGPTNNLNNLDTKNKQFE